MYFTVRCPACRAENSEGPTCRRCKADLSLLFALEQQRACLLAEADRSFAQRDWAAVERSAAGAAEIRAGGDCSRYLAMAYLVNGKFEQALAAYRNAVKHD